MNTYLKEQNFQHVKKNMYMYVIGLECRLERIVTSFTFLKLILSQSLIVISDFFVNLQSYEKTESKNRSSISGYTWREPSPYWREEIGKLSQEKLEFDIQPIPFIKQIRRTSLDNLRHIWAIIIRRICMKLVGSMPCNLKCY